MQPGAGTVMDKQSEGPIHGIGRCLATPSMFIRMARTNTVAEGRDGMGHEFEYQVRARDGTGFARRQRTTVRNEKAR